jgi:hypothetical protein
MNKVTGSLLNHSEEAGSETKLQGVYKTVWHCTVMHGKAW